MEGQTEGESNGQAPKKKPKKNKKPQEALLKLEKIKKEAGHAIEVAYVSKNPIV